MYHSDMVLNPYYIDFHSNFVVESENKQLYILSKDYSY